MLYRALADFVVLIHFAFIAFVLLGGFLTLRWRWIPYLHLPAATWGTTVEIFGWYCPLTPLENWLRRSGGASGYSDGFIEEYLMPVLYPVDLTRELQLILGCALVTVNIAIYLTVWRRFRATH